MTREQKLEAAWHKGLDAWMECSRDSTIHEADKAAVSLLAEALATPPTKPQQTTMPDWDDPPYTRSSCKVTTKRYKISPPTSEWNEAIEAALNAILDREQAYEAQGETASYIDLMYAVCALKRKEQP